MRLDHLLSKEKEVGIVLLLSCRKEIKYFKKVLDKRMNIRYNTKALLVTMRLRETPVPIPNTTVKT